MPTLACSHQEPGQARRACLRLLAKRAGACYKRFNGMGTSYDLICTACREQPEQFEANLRDVCRSCFEAIEEGG